MKAIEFFKLVWHAAVIMGALYFIIKEAVKQAIKESKAK